MEKDDNKLLPIGTVVRLKGATAKAMITRLNYVDEKNGHYDYCMCCYPEGGVYDEYCLNNEDIEEIYYLGYDWDNNRKYRKDYTDIIKKYNIKIDKLSTKNEYTNPSSYAPIGALVYFKEQNEVGMIAGHAVLAGLEDSIEDYMVHMLPDGNSGGAFSYDSDKHEFISDGYIDKECYEYMKGADYAMDRVRREHEAQKNSLFGRFFGGRSR